jgi:hypothetical protein
MGIFAFASCGILTNVTIGSGISKIPTGAFMGAAITNLAVPGNVRSIGENAFSHCVNLGRATIASGVVTISASAFAYCSKLSVVTIGSTTASLGNSAFAYCAALTNIHFQGNAPSASPTVFPSANNATVYYLPGTTGWGPTLAGRPTAPWLLPYPVSLAFGPSFGIRSNRFGFLISWATNASVVVEGSTDLGSAVWIPRSTNTLTDGSAHFSDPDWTNNPARYYRVRSL